LDDFSSDTHIVTPVLHARQHRKPTQPISHVTYIQTYATTGARTDMGETGEDKLATQEIL